MATTEIYSLSLHDALPISIMRFLRSSSSAYSTRSSSSISLIATCSLSKAATGWPLAAAVTTALYIRRSEEHTSELQSQSNLVCRLLLEKKKITIHITHSNL